MMVHNVEYALTEAVGFRALYQYLRKRAARAKKRRQITQQTWTHAGITIGPSGIFPSFPGSLKVLVSKKQQSGGEFLRNMLGSFTGKADNDKGIKVL